MAGVFAKAKTIHTGSTVPPETPFTRGAREWDNRIGTQTAHARNWRLMAFASIGIAAIFAAGFVIESNKSHYQVFIVPVNEVGQPGKVRLASENYDPTAAQKAKFVADWINDLFAKPTDPVVLSKDVNFAFSVLDGQAKNTVIAWGQINDPTTAKASLARVVTVTSVLQKTENTFQADWTEKTFDNGAPAGSQNFTGLFTLKTVPPTDEAQILANPLGLRIETISWTRG